MAESIDIDEPTLNQLLPLPEAGGAVTIAGVCECPSLTPFVTIWTETGGVFTEHPAFPAPSPTGPAGDFDWSVALFIVPPSSGEETYNVHARLFTADPSALPPVLFNVHLTQSHFRVTKEAAPPTKPPIYT